MYFKFIYKEYGAHTHFRVFSGPSKDYLGLAAEHAVMRNEEWEIFRQILENGDVRHDRVEFEEQGNSQTSRTQNKEASA